MRTVLGRATLLVLAVAAIPACSGGGGGDTAAALTPPWTDDFDGATAADGWYWWDGDTSSPPSTTNSTLWGIDGTPSTVPGGAFVSSPNSLNYNNGTNYDVGASTGTAITPKLDISGMTAPILVFLCNYETEEEGTTYDQRHVKIGYLDSSGSPSYFYEGQCSTTSPIGGVSPCAAMGTWHEHVISMDPTWGEVRIAFGFDSIDSFSNAFAGWFIDNIQVIEAADYVPWTPGGGSGGGGTGGGGTGGGGTGGGGSGGGGSTPGVVPAPYTTTFDPATTTGWTLGPGGSSVAWAFDGTPAAVPGGPAFTGTTSLNYNNATDYDTPGVANTGTAASPPIDVTTVTGGAIEFRCNYETETAGVTYDQRWMRIFDNTTNTLLWEGQLAESGGASACSAAGSWHLHSIPVPAGATIIRVEFSFDTVDEFANNYSGWFIDDFAATGTPTSGGGGGSGGSGGGGAVSGTSTPAGPAGRHREHKFCGGSAAAGSGLAPLLLALAILGVEALRPRNRK